MASYTLNLQLTCLSKNIKLEKVLPFDTQPETLADVKQAIEDKLSIPACVQVLSVPGRYVKSDEDKLTDLYVENGGEIAVEYTSQGDCSGIKKVVSYLEKFHSEIEGNITEESVDRDYWRFNDCLSYLSYACLSPWRSARTTANAMYLDQLGAFSLLVRILKCSQDFTTSSGESAYKEIVFPQILSVFWNLAETTERQSLVLKHGGFELMLDALVRESEVNRNTLHPIGCITKYVADFDMHFVDTIIHLNSRFFFSSYCETPSCRMKLANSPTALDRMITFAGKKVGSVFGQQLVTNAFFRLSFSLETHPLLGREGGETLKKLVKLGEQEVQYCAANAETSCVL